MQNKRISYSVTSNENSSHAPSPFLSIFQTRCTNKTTLTSVISCEISAGAKRKMTWEPSEKLCQLQSNCFKNCFENVSLKVSIVYSHWNQEGALPKNPICGFLVSLFPKYFTNLVAQSVTSHCYKNI